MRVCVHACVCVCVCVCVMIMVMKQNIEVSSLLGVVPKFISGECVVCLSCAITGSVNTLLMPMNIINGNRNTPTHNY